MADDIDDEDDDTVDASLEDRKKDYSEYKYIRKQLGDVYDKVVKGLENKNQQNNIVDENWDIYNCVLNENQGYNGISEVYVPIVRDAMAARETRFINMLFPGTGRYTDIIAEDGHEPYDLIAVLDNYVRSAKLRTKVIPAMIRTGDVGGNYSLYVEWSESTRYLTSKTKVAEISSDRGTPVDGSPEYDDIEHSEEVEGRPDVMVLDPRRLVILPVSASGPQPEDGAEIVSITLDFTKEKIRRYIKEGKFEKQAAETLLDNMKTAQAGKLADPVKDANQASGVQIDGKGNVTAKLFQVWTKLKIKGEYRMMVTHFASDELVLGCKRNPYWCDRVPVIHEPVDRAADSVWGPSPINPGVQKLQYEANDAVAKGFDSSSYALLPIVMTDPDKNPRSGTMILAMASVWLCDPNSTKFAEFPKVWQDAFTIVGSCKQQIFESLSVNPAMIPHANAGKKPSQAQIAQEQQVALESSADSIALVQEGVLGKLVEWFYELDYQYRTEAITVKKYGTLGLQATMDQVEPFQVRERFEFKWYGTEGFKAAQQVQQMISWMGTIVKVPPQMLNGRKVDIGPIIESINGTILGPRVAPHVLIDQRHQLTMSPEMENRLLHHSFPVQVHEMDDDQEHIQSHFQEFEQLLQQPPEIIQGNNVVRLVKGHIMEHIKAAKAKAQAAMGAQPGSVGAPPPGRAGAQLQGPSGPQQPAGAVRPDAMPLSMPRKAG